jgi:hypothetical protein
MVTDIAYWQLIMGIYGYSYWLYGLGYVWPSGVTT